MTKKTDQTRSHGRKGKIPNNLKPPTKAALRSEKYRLKEEKDYRRKQLNLMAPADQESRDLLKKVAEHLSTPTDEISTERRAQIQAILSSPAAHEPLPIMGAGAAPVTEQDQLPVAIPARTPDPIAECLKRELLGRQDAWPLLLRILKDKQLLADVRLAAKRPDGIEFLRGLIRNRPTQIAAMTAARDPSVVDLGQRLKDAHRPTMLAIRLLLSLERSLCDFGQRLAAMRRETTRTPVRARS